MALDFPSPATLNQAYQGPNGIIWTYDGAKWISGTSALDNNTYLPLTGGVVTGPTTIMGATFTAHNTLIGSGVVAPPAANVTPSWHAGGFQVNLAGVHGANLYNTPAAWNYIQAGFGYYLYQDPSTGQLQLTSFGSGAADAPTNTGKIWAFNQDSSFTAPGAVWVGNKVNDFGLQDFGDTTWGIRFAADGWRLRWSAGALQYLSNTEAVLWNCDNQGNVGAFGAVTAAHAVASNTGRVISQSANNPGFCCHWPGVYAAGMIVDGGGGLQLGQMDGNGNWVKAYCSFATDTSVRFFGAIYPNAAIYDIAGRPNFSMFGGASNERYVQLETSIYITKGSGVDLTMATYQATGTLYNSTSGGWMRVNSDAGFQLSSGWAGKPGGGAWSDSSDARIKTIDGDYTQGLAAIVQLQPRVYRFKGNDELDNVATVMPEAMKRMLTMPVEEIPADRAVAPADRLASAHAIVAEQNQSFIGLVAQEVEGAMPEMVTTKTGFIDNVHVDDIRQLDTSALSMAFINAFKELHARVLALEAAATPAVTGKR